MEDNKKVVELTEDELDNVVGGANGDTRYKYWRCISCTRTHRTIYEIGTTKTCEYCGGTVYSSESPWPGQSY